MSAQKTEVFQGIWYGISLNEDACLSRTTTNRHPGQCGIFVVAERSVNRA